MNLNEIVTTTFATGTNCLSNIANLISTEIGVTCNVDTNNNAINISISDTLNLKLICSASTGNGIFSLKILDGEGNLYTDNTTMQLLNSSSSTLNINLAKKSENEFAIGITGYNTNANLSLFVSTATSIDKSQTLPCVVFQYDKNLFGVVDGMTSLATNMSRTVVSENNFIQLAQLGIKNTKFICDNIYFETQGTILSTNKHQIGGKNFISSTVSGSYSSYSAVLLKLD